jgi:hypothetical protein
MDNDVCLCVLRVLFKGYHNREGPDFSRAYHPSLNHPAFSRCGSLAPSKS